MKQAIIDALIRAGRTGGVAFLTVYLAAMSNVTNIADMATWGFWQPAVLAFIVAAGTFALNVLENGLGVSYRRG